MTDQQIKLIYDYMKEVEGWDFTDYLMFKQAGLLSFDHRVLDSNSASECVQEIVKQRDWTSFKMYAWTCSEGDIVLWLYNPENFFNCFGDWLEGREG